MVLKPRLKIPNVALVPVCWRTCGPWPDAPGTPIKSLASTPNLSQYQLNMVEDLDPTHIGDSVQDHDVEQKV